MALEARGVRVAALRRETAAIIASEIPTAASNGSPSPHRSDELADVLRAASTVAARRNAAAGTDDLMQVLLDQRAKFPTSELLARFTSRVALRDGHDPLPPLTRSGTDLRYVASPAFRHGPESPRGYRGDFTASPTDAIQNSRIEALGEFAQRLSAVECAIAAEIETAAAKHQAYANDLSEVHEALMKLNQNQHTLAGLANRLFS